MRLVVVGNAPITEPIGERIDSFDRVVRMNHFEIKGYEPYVGERIDIVCARPALDPDGRKDVYGWEYPHFPNHLDAAKEIWFPYELHDIVTNPNHLRFVNIWVKRFYVKKRILIPDCTFWQPFLAAHDFRPGKWPSTGYVTIHIALHLGYKVSIAGFNGGVGGYQWNTSAKMWVEHDMGEEYSNLMKLRDSGRIEFLENRNGD